MAQTLVANRWIVPFAFALAVAPGVAEGYEFASPEEQVTLIELFTSEGCNSCPPADAWLAGLASSEALWTQFVPIAFHVTYWDYLGWRDRFARVDFDTLHRLRALRASAAVYTPGVFAAGAEWHRWRSAPRAHERLPRPVAGRLELELDHAMASAGFTTAIDLSEATFSIAFLQVAQHTDVRAGENEGRTLQHAFVARTLQSTPMQRLDGRWRGAISIEQDTLGPLDAVAAWISGTDGHPVQAVGGWLAEGLQQPR